MFTLKIVDSDAFLDMGQGAQLLYFHLSMRADDDGFVDNPKRILRMVGGNDDDLKILLAKRFLIAFDSGIVVIKHWRMHNYIQNDRYSPTQYIEERCLLHVKENGAYTDKPTDVSKTDTQVRLGKVRLGKDTHSHSVRDEYDEDFTSFWNAYPKKVGKGAAWSAWKRAKPPATSILLTVLEQQKDSEQWTRENGRFIPHPATWINQKRWDDEIHGSSRQVDRF